MTCLEFAGGFTKIGEADPVQANLQAFMNEEVPFDAPEGCAGYSTGIEVSMNGTKADKKVTWTIQL